MECDELKGTVTNIQRFSYDDGPGIRTTVFLKGCNLKCFWCQNPETQSFGREIAFYREKCTGCGECKKKCGKAAFALFRENCDDCVLCSGVCYSGALKIIGQQYSAAELADVLMKDKELFEISGGGVTFSGGEPLMQSEFLVSVMSMLKASGVNIALETALNVPVENIRKIFPFTSLIYADIKIIDDIKHTEATGCSNKTILKNIRYIAGKGVPLIIRTPVIPGFNDSEKEICEIKEFVDKLNCKAGYELLRFNGMCAGKYTALNREYRANKLSLPEEKYTELVSYANAAKKQKRCWR